MKETILYIINPVTIVAVLFLFGLLSSRLKNKVKLFYYSLTLFLISSIPITSFILSYPLINTVKTINEKDNNIVQSVIVLTAGIKKNIIGEWSPSINSINRTLLGKKYSEKFYVPLVISGGKTKTEAFPESIIIKNYFNLYDSVIDQKSINTFESAKNLSEYCKKNKGPHLLITGEYHRLRSYLSFKSHECDVLLLEKNNSFSYKLFLPSNYGISLFENVIYEYIGLIYYILSNKIKILILLDI